MSEGYEGHTKEKEETEDTKDSEEEPKEEIKLVVFDFDGVFTDGKIYVSADGSETKCYNGKDSYALKLLNENKISTRIITADTFDIIGNCRHIFPRVEVVSYETVNKLDLLNKWVESMKLEWSQVAYIGDDLPDIPCMKKVGFSGCPANAVPEVRSVSDFIATKDGGDGAVRQFVDEIIRHKIRMAN